MKFCQQCRRACTLKIISSEWSKFAGSGALSQEAGQRGWEVEAKTAQRGQHHGPGQGFWGFRFCRIAGDKPNQQIYPWNTCPGSIIIPSHLSLRPTTTPFNGFQAKWISDGAGNEYIYTSIFRTVNSIPTPPPSPDLVCLWTLSTWIPSFHYLQNHEWTIKGPN